MSPVRHASRRLATLVSARHACVADLAAVTPRGAIAWRASPFAAPGRVSAPRSFAFAPRSAQRGFAAGARAWASAKGPGGDGPAASASRAESGANAEASASDDAATDGGGSVEDGGGGGTAETKPGVSPEPERDAANPLAGMMFPWERAVLSGDRTAEPMSDTQKLYWAVFAFAVVVLVVNRVRVYLANRKTKDELAEELKANRAAMHRALEGQSFANEEDPFEGMEPGEIEAFLKQQAPDGDPYAGMTPEEINAYLRAQQERAVRENLSVPRKVPNVSSNAPASEPVR